MSGSDTVEFVKRRLGQPWLSVVETMNAAGSHSFRAVSTRDLSHAFDVEVRYDEATTTLAIVRPGEVFQDGQVGKPGRRGLEPAYGRVFTQDNRAPHDKARRQHNSYVYEVLAKEVGSHHYVPEVSADDLALRIRSIIDNHSDGAAEAIAGILKEHVGSNEMEALMEALSEAEYPSGPAR